MVRVAGLRLKFRLVEAAQRQMATLPFYHGFAHKSHGPGIELAERLLKLMPVPMSKVFFNSGSDANDTAIKIVWYYNNAIGRRKRRSLSPAYGPTTTSPSPPLVSPVFLIPPRLRSLDRQDRSCRLSPPLSLRQAGRERGGLRHQACRRAG